MSTTTELTTESNFLIGVTDVSKIFLGNNLTENDSYVNNSGYDPITLLAGTVLGRVASTGILVPSVSTAGDGSQYVVGILGQDLQISAGGTVKALVFVGGKIAQEQVKFFVPTDNLWTVVGSRNYHDKIQAEAVGIQLIQTSEQSYEDNS